MFCKRVANIHNKGKEHLDELREEHRAESKRLLGVLGGVLAAAQEAIGPPEPDGDGTEAAVAVKKRKPEPAKVVNERAGRLMLKKLEEAGWRRRPPRRGRVGASRQQLHLPLLEKYYKSHRSALFTPLDSVELEPTSAKRSVLDAVEFVKANRNRTGEHIPEKGHR